MTNIDEEEMAYLEREKQAEAKLLSIHKSIQWIAEEMARRTFLAHPEPFFDKELSQRQFDLIEEFERMLEKMRRDQSDHMKNRNI